MPINKRSIENLTPMQPGDPGLNPKGSSRKARERKAARTRVQAELAEFLGERAARKLKPYNCADMVEWLRVIYSADLATLTALVNANKERLPMFVVSIIRALQVAIKDGDARAICDLRNYVYGAEKRRIELSGDVALPPKELTEEEMKQLLKSIEEEC